MSTGVVLPILGKWRCKTDVSEKIAICPEPCGAICHRRECRCKQRTEERSNSNSSVIRCFSILRRSSAMSAFVWQRGQSRLRRSCRQFTGGHVVNDLAQSRFAILQIRNVMWSRAIAGAGSQFLKKNSCANRRDVTPLYAPAVLTN